MSNEVKTKEKVDMDPKYIIKLTVTLFLTCLVVAAALGGVNAITADKIAAINWENTQKAMKEVVADPDNTEFTELELTDDMTAAASTAGGTLDSAYEVVVNGENDGYAIKVVASGSQGNIEMMVGVDGEGTVTGVSIVDNSETAGIGSKVMDNEPLASGVPVLEQFEGKSEADMPLTVGSNVDASSVTRAVRDMFKETSDILPTAEVIIEEVGKFYDIDPNAIRGQGRTKATSWARHIAIYLTRHMTKLSLKDIGKEFDNRDHTTILHSIDRVEKQCKTDPETNEVIKDIRSNINERYN